MSTSKERLERVRSRGMPKLNVTSIFIVVICVSVAYICYSTMKLGAHDTNSHSSQIEKEAPPSYSYSELLKSYATDMFKRDPPVSVTTSGEPPKLERVKPMGSDDHVGGKIEHNHVHSEIEVLKCPYPGGEARWCNVPPPAKSHFGFDDAPSDLKRWKAAQILASSGEQVLLKRIIKHFPHPFDYLDGDRSFRGLQKLVDVFVDSKTGLQPLLPAAGNDPALWSHIRRLQHSDEAAEAIDLPVSVSMANTRTHARKQKQKAIDQVLIDAQVNTAGCRRLQEEDGGVGEGEDLMKEKEVPLRKDKDIKASDPTETTKALHVDGKQIVPLPYNFRVSNRAPVVEMGYTAFDKNLNTYFSGNFAGGNFVKKEWFFDRWHEIKNKLDYQFITMCSLNENWGVLSTNFPNRTAGWGSCCNKPSDKKLHDFLAHDKTLMFIINQHSNLSHPKLMTLPRGLPMQWEHTARVVWDTQRHILNNVKKTKLLFAAASSWGKRPQMLRCISDKMAVDDFWGHSDAPKEHVSDQKKAKTNRRLYYQKLGTSIIGVALPGLGYDCFRTWELLTMGSLVVTEHGVGLDRTLWRLPALLVEDFYDVTPELLLSAYVEAIYRADEFEFERLTQSFWYGVIANVSYSKSTQPMLDKFPMKAEIPNFARPKVPYACSNTGTCGEGTKRTPRKSC